MSYIYIYENVNQHRSVLVKGRKDQKKKIIWKSQKKNLKQYLQNWKIDINWKKDKTCVRKKVKTFVLNGYPAMPVNPTHIYIYIQALKHVDV